MQFVFATFGSSIAERISSANYWCLWVNPMSQTNSSWDEVQTVIEGNISVAAAVFALILLGIFYFIGVGFGKVKKAHSAWVEQQN